jgi:endonuclease/exonuclease/phosphatase family metal-dependent hydrolase
MRLISLNLWGGTINEPLLQFLAEHSDVDFFLFQEMHHNATEKTNWDNRGNPNLFIDIQKVLSGHDGYFAPAEAGEYGPAGFIKKGITIREHSDIFIHRHKDAMVGTDATLLGRNLQFFKISGTKEFSILNFHGLWTGKGKLDTPDRMKQSERIVEFAKTLKEDFVLTGDFNLMPETESVAIIERMGTRNLIKEYGVTSTRTSLYKKTTDQFADFTFVTPGIKVNDFKVLPDEVSDHAALYLDFE